MIVDSSRQSIPSSTIVESIVNKGKKTVGVSDMVRSSSSHVRLSPFFEEIKKSFSRYSLVGSVEGSPNFEQKFHMTFDKTASVSVLGYISFMYVFSIY